MNLSKTIREILNISRQYGIMLGSESWKSEYPYIMNEYANYILSQDSLESEDIEGLDALLRLCNILYNNTSLEVLPIEDGVYDLLLEKYKPYNSNFQVGAEMIKIISDTNGNGEIIDKISPLKFYNDQEWENRVNGFYYSELYNHKVITVEDLGKAPFRIEQDIAKRTHNTEHSHPELVGTLDKCKFVLMQDAIDKGVDNDPTVKVLERDFFADHIRKGILDPNREITMVLELKYDGVSVEADCDNVVQSARSRGDTGIGAASDITPILKDYPFTHAKEMIGEKPIGVKFEAIMTHQDLANFNLAKNYSYKNCRTAIVGLFGSGDAWKYRDYITLVPLAIDRSDIPDIQWNRQLEIEFINKIFVTKGQPLRYSIIKGDYKHCLFLIKKFLEEAEVARNFLNFMYDGIVVSYMDEDLRQILGRENFINKYSMAVKFNPLKKQTTFRGYTYTVGQDGSITPMIHYDQVEFYGTIHTKSTGSSFERFNKLALKVGDIINVTYTNDVMPYVSAVDCVQNDNNPNPPEQFISHCPSCGSELILSKSGKTMVCQNQSCEARTISRVSNMMQKLNLKDFGEERIKQLNKTHLYELLELTYDETEFLGPTIAQNFLDRMNELKTKPIYDYEIVGAIGFTGIARKKWQLIFSVVTLRELYCLWKEGTLKGLNHIKGIGDSILDTIDIEMEYFEPDILYILNNMRNVQNSRGVKSGKSIRFSGFRNKELVEQLQAQGYDADDNASVTKTTDILLVPYPDYSSSKTKKVGPNTLIIPIQEFLDNMSKFLQ